MHGGNHGGNYGDKIGNIVEILLGVVGKLKENSHGSHECGSGKDYIGSLIKLLEDLLSRGKDSPELECLQAVLKSLIEVLTKELGSLDGCPENKKSQLIGEIQIALAPILAKATSCFKDSNGSSEDLEFILIIVSGLLDKLKKGCD